LVANLGTPSPDASPDASPNANQMGIMMKKKDGADE